MIVPDWDEEERKIAENPQQYGWMLQHLEQACFLAKKCVAMDKQNQEE